MTTHLLLDRRVRHAVRAAWIVASFASIAYPALSRADVTLNFANADIEQIARAIGAATNQTIVVDPRVKGQLSLQSDRPVSDEQALKTLQAALRMQGFTLVEDHGILKVVPEADAKLQGVPTYVSNAPQARGDTVVTQVFQLHNASASNMLPVLRPLVSPNNTVAAYPNTNSIVVTDYADNVRRIGAIIAGIDTAENSNIDVIPLANANAVDVATEAQKLLDPTNIGATDPTLKVSVNVDTRTNSIVLRASNAGRLRAAHNLIAQLDAPTRSPGNMHVVSLENADATQLAKTLRGMLGQAAGGAGAAGASAAGAGGGQAGSSGLANASGSLPPLPTGTGNVASLGGSGGSGSNGLASIFGANGANRSGSNANMAGSDQQDNQSGGMIVADASTNSLIITAPEPVYRNLRTVIAQLDQRRAQVYIESLIVEVSSNKSGQFGVQWQGGLSSSNGNAIVGNSNFNTSSSNGIFNLTAAGLAATSNTTTASALSGIASTALNNGINIGVLHRFGSILGLGGLLQALSTNSDVNVLSTPNLITLDNQEARILVGANIPIQQGSYSSGTATSTGIVAYNTYDRVDVGTMLNVRPQISQGGTVKLQIYQEDSSVDSTTATQAGGYSINKRSVQTTVLADNGEIVVLGGLISDNYANANSKVPWLGSIPILGALFRSESKSRQKTDLMVFLRPVIIRDAQQLRDISMNRYDFMRAESANYQTDNRLIRDKSLPVPPPVAPQNEAPIGRAVQNPDGTPGNDVNGLFDWRDRQRQTVPANAMPTPAPITNPPPVSPNPGRQPPYVPDPGVPSGAPYSGQPTQPGAPYGPQAAVTTPVPTRRTYAPAVALPDHVPTTQWAPYAGGMNQGRLIQGPSNGMDDGTTSDNTGTGGGGS